MSCGGPDWAHLYSANTMKLKHVIVTAAAGSAALAVEVFYGLPTFGRGVQALLAVLGLGGFF